MRANQIHIVSRRFDGYYKMYFKILKLQSLVTSSQLFFYHHYNTSCLAWVCQTRKCERHRRKRQFSLTALSSLVPF